MKTLIAVLILFCFASISEAKIFKGRIRQMFNRPVTSVGSYSNATSMPNASKVTSTPPVRIIRGGSCANGSCN